MTSFKKVDYMLEVKSKYIYRIFHNGNDEISIEVQLTSSFKKISLSNFALVTMSKENYENHMDDDKIHSLFLMLRKRISESGAYFDFDFGRFELVEI